MKLSIQFILIFLTGALASLSLVVYYCSDYHCNYNQKAIAVIYPTKDNAVHGVINFQQCNNALYITGHLSGLTPGKHGIHIHEYGDCSDDAAQNAGNHYNPTNQLHSSPENPQRHIGDLGNIIADAQGNAAYYHIDEQASLQGPYSIIGRSIIIHKNEDDFITQPTGNAGARLGCGIIGITH